jgi:transcriptional regulator GlxA family with amidase domain
LKNKTTLAAEDGEAALLVKKMATAIGKDRLDRDGLARVMAHSRLGTLSSSHENLAKGILLENLKGNISISKVAQNCNLSRGYFIRAFRATTGMTPYQWLLTERINRARQLLRTSNAPLTEIATACGFANQSHFTRVFSSMAGATPGTWRKNG